MSSIDVIVPCYNYGRHLEQCVRSVLGQEGGDVRVSIVDDCSSDDTPEVGTRLARSDGRVRYRRHETNRGNIATYNEALPEATADYCLILSADDVLAAGALRRAAGVMDDHPEVGLTYGRDVTFDAALPAQPPEASGYYIYGYPEFLALSCQLGHTPIQAPTAVVRTSLQHAVGYFLPELPHAGDTEIWLRLAANGAVCALDAVQAFRRLHPRAMSLRFTPLERLVEQRKAFEAHFRQYEGSRVEVGRSRPVVNRTIAENAFWAGVRAFEAGGARECDKFLAFAAALDPEVVSRPPWRRFRWKRRLGPAIAGRLDAWIAWARRREASNRQGAEAAPPAEPGR
jgi:glycosyltransferase involved in cell wall biosynthesis